MGKQLSQEIIDKIPILFQECGSKKEVAEQLKISVTSVNKYLNLYFSSLDVNECMTFKTKKIVKHFSKEDIQKINECYAKYNNLAAVAKEFMTTPAIIKKNLTEENLQLLQENNDDRDALWYYIYHLFGKYSERYPVSKWNLTQMARFNRQGMSYRSQLMTLKYFYEVKKHTTEKSHGSIGIIPHIFREAYNYYLDQAEQTDKIMGSIKKQLEMDRAEIKYNPQDYMGQKKKQKQIDINSVIQGGDDK